MAVLNLSVFLNSYSDAVASNAPSLSNVRWNRDLTALTVNNPSSMAIQLAPSETRTIFTAATKKFLYMESDTHITMAINGSTQTDEIVPFVVGTSTVQGLFMRSSSITSLTVTNTSTTASANVFLIATE